MTPPILLASGDELRRWLVEDTLSRNGFEVATARSGLECLERIRRSRYTALVLDLDLLWGGAEGVMDYLRRAEGSPMPVVVLGRPQGGPAPLGATARYVADPNSARELLEGVTGALTAAGNGDADPAAGGDRN